MKRAVIASLALAAACGSSSKKPIVPPPAPPAPPPVAPVKVAPPALAEHSETMTADTPRTTSMGATFTAPAGWTVATRGDLVIVSAPEGDSHIAFFDVKAADPDAAVAAAWAAYDPKANRKLQISVPQPARDGWEEVKAYQYETSPNEKRAVAAGALRAGGVWTAVIVDVALSTAEKRGAELNVILGHLLPKGGGRESFAGRTPHALDAEHVKILTDFVDKARQDLQIPGVAVAIVDHDKVVFEGGFGVRELGKKAPVDKDTHFMIASSTKALTTLLLARLVDQKKTTWETPVTQLYPGFKLGDDATTAQVQLRHLVCACTGLPRQDLEWIFEFGHLTPEGVIALLATMQPTTKFGETFQYSNALAAVAGYVAGHLLYPKKELGAAYDEAMRTQVFVPLGMKGVTFDFKKALAGNHAGAYGLDIDDHAAPDVFEINYASVPFRPAGGLWASVHDMIRYVRMELGNGMLDGKRVIGEDALLERRKSNVRMSEDDIYGMGLMVDTKYGITIVQHGGDLIGHHGNMFWLPDQQIGAVILTNGDNGPTLRAAFLRRLLEVVFDGKPEAEENVASAVRDQKAAYDAERPHLVVPPDPAEAGKLAAHYKSDALGALDVKHDGSKIVFDFGEWKSEVASRKNDDGTVSFELVTPGLDGQVFVVGDNDGKRTLTIRDAQHEYVFTEAAK